MKEHYLTGDIEKCWACNGRGYTISENHPQCPVCSGAGYIEVDEKKTIWRYPMTEKTEVEIECYNCYGLEGKDCMLCNGTKKTMVTKSFAKIMGYETCPGCGNVARLKFHKWVNNPSPASGVSEPGVYTCDECAAIGEAYDND